MGKRDRSSTPHPSRAANRLPEQPYLASTPGHPVKIREGRGRHNCPSNSNPVRASEPARRHGRLHRARGFRSHHGGGCPPRAGGAFPHQKLATDQPARPVELMCVLAPERASSCDLGRLPALLRDPCLSKGCRCVGSAANVSVIASLGGSDCRQPGRSHPCQPWPRRTAAILAAPDHRTFPPAPSHPLAPGGSPCIGSAFPLLAR
jgi:hypothetical protein